jgi:16S rRNA (uracil1498-N3)-methyltransferase
VPPAEYGWAAASGAAAHVFVESLADELVVDGRDGHHLQRVRRLRTGEAVTAADGTGRWRLYVVTDGADGRLQLDASASPRTEPERRPRVSVAVALTKGGGLDDVVASLTELGVHRIEPVRAARSVVRWDAERASAAMARLRGIAREAAMQCRRARVPEIAGVADLTTLAGRAGLVVAARDGVGPADLAPPAGGEWLVVVGPEGGFTTDEVAALDAPRVNVGHFVLRAQTAPLAVVAALVQLTIPVPHVVN